MEDSDQNTFLESTIKVVEKYAGAAGNVAPDHRIFHDLGLYGDDIDEMIAEIPGSENVDWSGFEFADYFRCEGESEWWPLFVKLGFKNKERKALTVRQLADAIERGRWLP